MFNFKNCMIVMLLVLLAAAPILAEATGGSAQFNVATTLFAAGTEIPPGEYTVKWKANNTEATVTFRIEGKAPIVLKGKIQTADKKYQYDSMAVGKDSSGRDAIMALRFGGKKISIVFE